MENDPLVPVAFSKFMDHYTRWMENTKNVPSWGLDAFLKDCGLDYSLEELGEVKNILGFAGNIKAVEDYIKSRLIEIWSEE